MNIIYLCDADLGRPRGCAVHIIELSKNLNKLGAEVAIFVSSLGHFQGEENLDIRYAPILDIEILRPLSFRISLSIMLLWRLLTYRVDIIYAREIALYMAPFILGSIFKKPAFIEINNASLYGVIGKPEKIFPSIIFYARKLSFKLARKIIVADIMVRDLLAKEYDIELKKFVVIPMGANTELFRPMDKYLCREKLNLKKDYKYVGFVGTLYPFQGLEYLIESAPLILEKDRNVKFLIVGSGVNDRYIKTLVNRNGLTEYFIFTGEKEYSTVPYYINSFDVGISFVTPERAATFSFPLKIYEYLSCGCPVVIGNLKNRNELINTKVSPVVNAADSNVLSRTILDVLEKSDSFEDDFERLRKVIIDNFSWKITAEKTLRLFKDMDGAC